MKEIESFDCAAVSRCETVARSGDIDSRRAYIHKHLS